MSHRFAVYVVGWLNMRLRLKIFHNKISLGHMV